ncbi:hypothetical protein TNCV_1547601 [Trichonephila clavipes]|nr:hypothetical protein TNCV_1547601 [Trichonephila clavipes]
MNSDTTYPPHNFCNELKGREIFFSSGSHRLSPQDFGPIDLTSRYSVCTRKVFGGIGHRTQTSTLKSDALTSRPATALV